MMSTIYAERGDGDELRPLATIGEGQLQAGPPTDAIGAVRTPLATTCCARLVADSYNVAVVNHLRLSLARELAKQQTNAGSSGRPSYSTLLHPIPCATRHPKRGVTLSLNMIIS